MRHEAPSDREEVKGLRRWPVAAGWLEAGGSPTLQAQGMARAGPATAREAMPRHHGHHGTRAQGPKHGRSPPEIDMESDRPSTILKCWNELRELYRQFTDAQADGAFDLAPWKARRTAKSREEPVP